VVYDRRCFQSGLFFKESRYPLRRLTEGRPCVVPNISLGYSKLPYKNTLESELVGRDELVPPVGQVAFFGNEAGPFLSTNSLRRIPPAGRTNKTDFGRRKRYRFVRRAARI
jgi:hypothetical protein